MDAVFLFSSDKGEKMKTKNLKEYINEVQEKIDYRFDNIDLLLQAFTRSSYSIQYGTKNNEVLEFIGDRAVDYYVVKIIAEEFGFMQEQSDYYDQENDLNEFCIIANKNEADFTELKKQIVSNKTLAKCIDRLGFAKFMYLGDTDIENNIANQEKVKADLFEAIIGAITIDCDWNQKYIQNSIEYMLNIDKFLANIDTEEVRPDKFKEENAINALKELAEHGKCSIPKYDESDNQVEMSDGRLMWQCTCFVRSWGIKKNAYGTSKKIAKKYSAYLVLCEHYNIPNEYEDY